jgi:hypothetical protein
MLDHVLTSTRIGNRKKQLHEPWLLIIAYNGFLPLIGIHYMRDQSSTQAEYVVLSP